MKSHSAYFAALHVFYTHSTHSSSIMARTSCQEAGSVFFLRRGAVLEHQCLCVLQMEPVDSVIKAWHSVYGIYPGYNSKPVTHIGPVCMVIGHCCSKSQKAGPQRLLDLCSKSLLALLCVSDNYILSDLGQFFKWILVRFLYKVSVYHRLQLHSFTCGFVFPGKT